VTVSLALIRTVCEAAACGMVVAAAGIAARARPASGIAASRVRAVGVARFHGVLQRGLLRCGGVGWGGGAGRRGGCG